MKRETALVALMAVACVTQPARARELPPVDGSYVEPESHQALFVFALGPSHWMLADGAFFPLRPGAHGAWTVTVPDGTGRFTPPARAEDVWRFGGDGPKRYLQRRDALAPRALHELAQRTLTRLDEKLLGEQARFNACVAVLRDPDPERLHPPELASVDPAQIKARGGVAGWMADELAALLNGLRALDPARIDGDLATLAQARTRAAPLWSREEDARLMALIAQHRQSRDTIELRTPLIALAGHDRHESCNLMLLVPDARDPLAPLGPRGTVRRFDAQEVGRDSCDPQFDPRHATLSGGADVSLFFDAHGALVGAQLSGYMASEIFLADGRTPAEAVELIAASAREIGRQAE